MSGIKITKETIGNCELYSGAMEEIIGGIKYADHILSDPPYAYIKTHDFDKKFDERLLFENSKRLPPDSGFIGLWEYRTGIDPLPA
jgi:hypothetical protein